MADLVLTSIMSMSYKETVTSLMSLVTELVTYSVDGHDRLGDRGLSL